MASVRRTQLRRRMRSFNTPGNPELNRQLVELAEALEEGLFQTEQNRLTSKGDLLTHNGTREERLPVGRYRQRLTPQDVDAPELEWADDADGFDLVSSLMPALYCSSFDLPDKPNNGDLDEWRSRIGPALISQSARYGGYSSSSWDGGTVFLDGTTDYLRADSLAADHAGDIDHPWALLVGLRTSSAGSDQTIFSVSSGAANGYKALNITSAGKLEYKVINDAGTTYTFTSDRDWTHSQDTILGVMVSRVPVYGSGGGKIRDDEFLDVKSWNEDGERTYFAAEDLDSIDGDIAEPTHCTIGANVLASVSNRLDTYVKEVVYWSDPTDILRSGCLSELLQHMSRRGAHIDHWHRPLRVHGSLKFSNANWHRKTHATTTTWYELTECPVAIVDSDNGMDEHSGTNGRLQNTTGGEITGRIWAQFSGMAPSSGSGITSQDVRAILAVNGNTAAAPETEVVITMPASSDKAQLFTLQTKEPITMADDDYISVFTKAGGTGDFDTSLLTIAFEGN